MACPRKSCAIYSALPWSTVNTRVCYAHHFSRFYKVIPRCVFPTLFHLQSENEKCLSM